MGLSAGTKLGPYEIVAPLGAGGMGEVYRARDTRLDRDVAVKILPARLAGDPLLRQRFEREARTVSSLNHPHICTLYDIGREGETDFLVMEYLEGETLAERLKRGRLPLPELMKFGIEIAVALDKAHRKGVVHRDLKPGNIMLTKGGAKLMDFGLAKPTGLVGAAGSGSAPLLSAAMTADGLSPGSPLTSAGTLVGTIQYMSPEQIEGKEADTRTDIFALGATLYEMATGERAFQGKSQISVASAILEKDPEPISKTQPLVPAALDRVVAQCLAKDPDERFQNAHDVGLELKWLGAALSKGPTVTAEESGGQRPMLQRALPWGVAAVAVAALIAVVFLWKFAAPAPQSAMRFSAVANFAGVQAEPAISPEGRSVAFVSNHDGHFDIYVTLVGGGNMVQITHDPNLESGPSWSPDGTTLAYARLNDWGHWDIWEIPALGGTPRRLVLNASDPDWSRDGQSLAYHNSTDGGIWISNVSGESARQAMPSKRELHNTEPSFSPDGSEIAFVVRGGGPYSSLGVVNLTSGKVRLLTHESQGAEVLSPAWSADGRSIYFASSRGGTINIWKIAATGGEPEQITAGEGDDTDLDVSKDGKRLVFGTRRQKVGISRLDLQAQPGEQSVKVMTTDPARNQLGPAYSPDGKHLAYFTNLSAVEREQVWVSDADGSNAAPLVKDSRVNVSPKWTPDGKSIIYASYGRNGREYRRIPLTGGAPQTLPIKSNLNLRDGGRDGRLLLQAPEGKAEVFDPRTGKTQMLGTIPEGAGFPHWSPDQNSVAYVVSPNRADDPKAGLWIDNFKNPPRQIFRGWIFSCARGPENELYLLEGKADLNAVLWKVNWNGQNLTRTGWTILTGYRSEAGARFDVSPDGRYLAFDTDQVLNENISMIENVR